MATTMGAADASAVVLNTSSNARQFLDLFTVIQFTFTFDENSIENLTSSSADLTITGAALGDFVLIAPTIDLVDCHVFGFVRAANSVTIMATNLEEVDASTTLNGNASYNGLILQPRGIWAGGE